jgi:hypothetical protein
MRCPDCNKFVSFDEGEPEVESIEVDESGNVRAEVRIVNNCSECGQELKDGRFEFDADHSEECKEHQGTGHELSIEETSSDRTGRSGYFKKGVFVSAYGRYAKTFYGVEVSYEITCSCNDEFKVTGTFSDEMQGSSMEELV